MDGSTQPRAKLLVLEKKCCWLVVGSWFVLREKYCCLVADKPNEQGVARHHFGKDQSRPEGHWIMPMMTHYGNTRRTAGCAHSSPNTNTNTNTDRSPEKALALCRRGTAPRVGYPPRCRPRTRATSSCVMCSGRRAGPGGKCRGN
jgi:hypothetical protein